MFRIVVTLLSLFSLWGLADDMSLRPVDNRDKVRPVGLPDLTVTALTEPRYQGGGTYVFDVTIRNIGRVWAPASTLLFWDIQMQHGQRRQVGPLAARAGVTLRFALGAPENQGPFYYSASADYGNAIREQSEINNLSTFHE